MYKQSHKDVKLKVDLDLPKILVIAITIFITLVIPIQVINYYRSKPETDNTLVPKEQQVSGRVAGASTTIDGTNETSTTAKNSGFKLSKSAAPYVYLGVFFITTSMITIVYLAVDGKKGKSDYF